MAAKSDINLNKLLLDIEVDKIGTLALNQSPDNTITKKARALLREPRSIIVIAMEIFPEVVNFITSQRTEGAMALRDLYRQNSNIVEGRLGWEIYKIVKNLHRAGFQGVPMPSGGPYDSRYLEAAFSYKHAAEKAGLGIIGWNGLLLTPEYGPRVRIASVVTDAPFITTPLATMEKPCTKCQGACIKICPAKAIARPRKNEPYNIDKYLCSTYLTASGMCSECVRVCPAGKLTRSGARK